MRSHGWIALLLVLCLLIPLLSPLPALAAAAPVAYMPGVTEEMTVPAFWKRKAARSCS